MSRGLVLLTFGYVAVAALTFAALSRSRVDLISFPVVVTLWTAYLWVFTARSIRAFSLIPRSPRRVARIIIVCCVVALAALAASIVIGLLIVGPRV
jgi:hypothetical protein